MSSMGDLAGLLGIQKTIAAMGQGQKERMELKQRDEAMRRSDPTLTELAGQYDDANKQFPGSLAELFKAKNPSDPMDNYFKAAQLALGEKREGRIEEDRDEVKMDSNVGKLQTKLEPLQDNMRVMEQLDNLMGFKMEDYDSATGTLKSTGREPDMPGFNLFGKGPRINWFSGKAQDIDDTLQTLQNIQLKDRSGAAVTVPEFERFKKEYAQGLLRDEGQRIKSLARARDGFIRKMKEIESGFQGKYVDEYVDRGGTSSKKYGEASPGGMPEGADGQAMGKDGKMHWVNSTTKQILGPVN